MKYLLALLILVTSNVFSAEFEENLRLAKLGDVDAQYRVGVHYELNINYIESIKWYKRAASQGHSKAQFFLANKFCQGHGTPKNMLRCYVWLEMSRLKGFEGVDEIIKSVKQRMTKEQIAKGEELASKCWESKFKDCD